MVGDTHELSVGIKGKVSEVVTEDKTAISVGSGTLRVFGTPALSALMERTAYTSIIDMLETGTCSVGSRTVLEHLAPTLVGSTVTCETELVEIDRRRLSFKFNVSDDAGEIAKGTHDRFIVDIAKFLEKAAMRV
ncbi:MAG: thioesterase family protein [Candidatus Methanomethylophilaceae archaeon]|nr:fluoroacetyl-CoA thioesterase [Candidatus Methanomethylophilaceae archaeon]